MTKTLFLLIKDAKNHDEEAFIKVIDKFKYTIIRFSNDLGYEESETDLTIAIIEIIQKIDLNRFYKKNDGAICNYIYNSLKNIKVNLYKKYVKKILLKLN